MLSIIGCSNDNDARIEELENQIKELQQAQSTTVAAPAAWTFKFSLEMEMTAEEIATAQRLAVECVAKEFKGCMTSY